MQQLTQQNPEGPDFNALQGSALLAVIGGMEACGTKVPQSAVTLSVVQNIVRIQVAMTNASGMQMIGS